MLILRSRTLILRMRYILGGPLHPLLDDAAEADGARYHRSHYVPHHGQNPTVAIAHLIVRDLPILAVYA